MKPTLIWVETKRGIHCFGYRLNEAYTDLGTD